MKYSPILVALFSALAVTAAPPYPGCLDVCRVVRPVCAEGEAPTGGPGCWGCCAPIKTLTTKPTTTTSRIFTIPVITPTRTSTVTVTVKPSNV
ncbi:hypothetical protein BJ165DRAFT_1503073 [Panaeolus papilionaceus]|nr:hypothetical protein BJ165DRAFT_1503073 [Panaeolus papilionaceus]